MDQFDKTVNNLLAGLDNEYVSTALSLFLILYAGLAAPKLPESIARLFENDIFKVLICFLIAYTGNKNPTVAIISTICLLVSLQTLHRYEVNRQMIAVASEAAPVVVSEELPAEMSYPVEEVGEELQELQGVSEVDDLEEHAPVEGSSEPDFDSAAELEEAEGFRGVRGRRPGCNKPVRNFDDMSLNYARY